MRAIQVMDVLVKTSYVKLVTRTAAHVPQVRLVTMPLVLAAQPVLSTQAPLLISSVQLSAQQDSQTQVRHHVLLLQPKRNRL